MSELLSDRVAKNLSPTDVAVVALMEIQVLTIPLFICKVHLVCDGGCVWCVWVYGEV